MWLVVSTQGCSTAPLTEGGGGVAWRLHCAWGSKETLSSPVALESPAGRDERLSLVIVTAHSLPSQA